MSVGVLIHFKSDQREPVYIPVATEQLYAKYWVAAAPMQGMEWIPHFQTGATVPLEDLPRVLEELAHLREHFERSPCTEPGLAETFLSRLQHIQNTLAALEPDEVEELFIG